MKALTLCHPWPSQIVHAFKRHEIRSWLPQVRGRIAIHVEYGVLKDAATLCESELPRARLLRVCRRMASVIPLRFMGRLFEQIKQAVREDRFLVGWHADERCEERGATDWQVVSGLDDAELVRERPRSKPNPSVVVRQVLPGGYEIEAIWSWLAHTGEAKLVTVYFRE